MIAAERLPTSVLQTVATKHCKILTAAVPFLTETLVTERHIDPSTPVPANPTRTEPEALPSKFLPTTVTD